MTELNQKRLKELLDYDTSTGVFTNKTTRGNRAKKGAACGTLSKARSSGKPYLAVMLEGKKYYLHRLAYLYMVGKYPRQVNHINGNGLDNSWENLREVCNQGNQRNRKKAKNNSSGVTGVTWCKQRKKWEAQIMVDRKCKHLGRFANFDDAVAARKKAELEYGFHENHGK